MVGSAIAAVGSAIAGKAINKFMGGDKPQYAGGGNQEVTQIQKVFIPPYLEDTVTNLAKRASEFSLRPYTPYTGERFAPFNQDQLNAFQGVRGSLGQYLPQYQNAFDLNQQAANRALTGFVTPEAISRYMSPYQQQVTDIAKREALRDFDMQLNTIGDSAVAAGAFGGDRHGIVESEAYRGLNQRLGDIQLQGLNQNYSQALNTALQTGVAETQTLGQSALQGANLAGAAQGYNLNDFASLQQIGGQQQAYQQGLRDFDYSQFAQERDLPYQQMSQLMSLISPLLGQSSNTNTVGQQFNPGTSNAQAGLAGSQILGPLFQNAIGGMFSGGFNMPTGLPVKAVSGPATGSWVIPTFKEGGPVKSLKQYAVGGPVNTSFESFLNELGLAALEPYVPKQGDSRLKRLGGFASNMWDETISSPLRAAHGVETINNSLLKYLNANPDEEARKKEVKKLAKEAEKKALAEGKSRAQATREKHMIENAVLAQTDPEKYGHLLPGMTADEKTTHFAKVKMNEVARELGLKPKFFNKPEVPQETPQGSQQQQPEVVQTRNPMESLLQSMSSKSDTKGTPQRMQDTSIFATANLPNLAMGAKILQSTGMSPLAAYGAGLSAYIDATKEQNAAALAGKQQSFDNMLKMMNASEYSRQNDLQERRMMFEAEKLPLEKGKLAAEMLKLQAEAEALGDPVATEAAKMTAKQIGEAPNMYNAENVSELYQSNYSNLQQLKRAQGLASETQIKPTFRFNPETGQLESVQ